MLTLESEKHDKFVKTVGWLQKLRASCPKEFNAGLEFYMLNTRLIHPDGKFDNAQRWYPNEDTPSLRIIRAPSRNHPFNYMIHCRTAIRVSELREVDAKIIRKTKKNIDIFVDFLELKGKEEIERALDDRLLSFDNINISENNEGNLKKIDTKKLTYEVAVDVERIHDKIQNEVTIFLRGHCLDTYKKVDIEKSHVDIKALTHDGLWHYYEVKTSNVRLSIREAIGQIMEYAYFPNCNKADKLFVVSLGIPTQEETEYLSTLRSKFTIPIYYCYYDEQSKRLSKPF